MKKGTILILLLFDVLLISFRINGQTSNFKMDGTINIDSGTIELHFYPDYLPDGTNKITAVIKNKKFSLSGYIPESQGVFITVDNDYLSSDFIIDKDLQTISIDIDSQKGKPEVTNKTMQNEYPDYIAFYKEIDAKNELFYQQIEHLYQLYDGTLPDSIMMRLKIEQKALSNARDSTLLKYTICNPDSKIAFWNLARLINWGYEPIFDDIYNTFSETLKSGYAGKILYCKLQNGKRLAIGNLFPLFNCQNINNEDLSSDIFLKNKFTLVDFWFSGCAPCRVQFNNMKELYQQYSDNGFEIIGISVDQTKNKKDWEDTIVKDKLVWKQYWDKNGTESKKYSINAFPTNFLIDNTGKIIEKNISMDALNELLKSSL